MLRRHGFTLVELVIVILIIGIIAAIAAPRLFDASTRARDNSLKQTLSVVRDAIELYRAKNGKYPGTSGLEKDLKSDLAPYLQGSFPVCPIGPSQNASVTMSTSNPLTGNALDATGWKYNATTGEFICNNGNPAASDPKLNYDDL